MKEYFNSDTTVGRATRTFIQAIIAIIVAVVKVPGVPEAIYRAVQENAVVSIPVLTGIVTFVWNFLRKDVPNT